MSSSERQPIRGLSTCSACRQPIVWALTMKGKRIPLNPDPNEKGNLALTRTVDGHLVAIFVAPSDFQISPRYTSHFANCPGAHNFRKPRKRSGQMRQP